MKISLGASDSLPRLNAVLPHKLAHCRSATSTMALHIKGALRLHESGAISAEHCLKSNQTIAKSVHFNQEKLLLRVKFGMDVVWYFN